MQKMIINNVCDLDDITCVRMVLAVVKKGRDSKKLPYKLNNKFEGNYRVTCKKATGGSMTDVFWVTQDNAR